MLISRTREKLKQVQDEMKEIYPTVEVKIIQADFSIGKDELARIENELKNVPIGILGNLLFDT